MVLHTGASNPVIWVFISRMVLGSSSYRVKETPPGDLWHLPHDTLSEPEIRYAQIVKEVLALVYAYKKFSDYVLGKNILLKTDHKHLMPLLGNKNLDALQPCVLHFHMRLMRFQYSISQVPGKTLYIPDTLSRAPLNTPDANGVERDRDVCASCDRSSSK